MAREGKRILVFDDEPALRYTISEILRDEGYSIVAAGSLEDVASLLPSDDIGLVLADLGATRSGEGGIERLKTLAAEVPIVVVTGSGNPRELSAALLGVSSVILKPFDADDLVREVQDLMKEVPSGDQDPGGQGVNL